MEMNPSGSTVDWFETGTMTEILIETEIKQHEKSNSEGPKTFELLLSPIWKSAGGTWDEEPVEGARGLSMRVWRGPARPS